MVLLGKLNGMLKVVCEFVVKMAIIDKDSYNAWKGLVEKITSIAYRRPC